MYIGPTIWSFRADCCCFVLQEMARILIVVSLSEADELDFTLSSGGDMLTRQEIRSHGRVLNGDLRRLEPFISMVARRWDSRMHGPRVLRQTCVSRDSLAARSHGSASRANSPPGIGSRPPSFCSRNSCSIRAKPPRDSGLGSADRMQT